MIAIQLFVLGAKLIISVIADEITVTSTLETTTTKVPCHWSWARRHACAIIGFTIGFIGAVIIDLKVLDRDDCVSDLQRYPNIHHY